MARGARFFAIQEVRDVARAELGTKRLCGECGAKFYDLGKDPIICPKCEAVFVAGSAVPPKRAEPAAGKSAAKPAGEESAAGQEVEDTGDVEVVSLEDAEPDSDDDIPDIEDQVVDLEDDDSSDDDTFLEEDDEDGDHVSGLIGGVSGDEEES